MASWEATGPPVIVCDCPATVVTSLPEEKFCTAPSATSARVLEHGEREQDAQAAADQVDPEVADPVGA